MLAAQKGCIAVAKVLLEFGADLEAYDEVTYAIDVIVYEHCCDDL